MGKAVVGAEPTIRRETRGREKTRKERNEGEKNNDPQLSAARPCSKEAITSRFPFRCLPSPVMPLLEPVHIILCARLQWTEAGLAGRASSPDGASAFKCRRSQVGIARIRRLVRSTAQDCAGATARDSACGKVEGIDQLLKYQLIQSNSVRYPDHSRQGLRGQGPPRSGRWRSCPEGTTLDLLRSLL